MKFVKFLHIAILLLFSACVDDEEVFSDDIEIETMEDSLSITILMQNLRATDMSSESDLCFRFQYPIVMGYNNDSKIEIRDYAGFKDVVFNQMDNFNITDVKYPFTVFTNDPVQRVLIENEVAFYDLILECNYTTFRSRFENFIGQCFALEFPVSVRVNNSDISNLNFATIELFNSFLSEQDESFQLPFVYPLNVRQLRDDKVLTINSEFQFYKVFDACPSVITNPNPDPDPDPDPVPDPDPDPNPDPTDRIGCAQNIVVLRESSRDEIGSFNLLRVVEIGDTTGYTLSWLLNGVPFDPGTNLVYYDALGLTPGVEYILELIIDEPNCGDRTVSTGINYRDSSEFGCPKFSFVRRENALVIEDPLALDFDHFWTANGVQVNTTTDPNGDVILPFTNLPNGSNGTYNISLTSVSVDCGANTYEDQLVFPGRSCVTELTFTSTKVGDELYRLTADFPERSDILYKWVINGQTQPETYGGSLDAENNSIEVAFNSRREVYDICITAELPASYNCSDKVVSCRRIVKD